MLKGTSVRLMSLVCRTGSGIAHFTARASLPSSIMSSRGRGVIPSGRALKASGELRMELVPTTGRAKVGRVWCSPARSRVAETSSMVMATSAMLVEQVFRDVW